MTLDVTVDLAKYMSGSDDEFSDRISVADIMHLDAHLPWLDDCTNILDLGCGIGIVVNELRTSGKNAQGITYQEAEVAEAKERFGLDLVYGDIHKLPFSDGQYDAAIMWDVIEHTVAPLIALSEAFRVVKPGGKLLVFIPGTYWQHCKYHLLCLTPSQMTHLCERVGWTVHSISTHFSTSFTAKHGHKLFHEDYVYYLTKGTSEC